MPFSSTSRATTRAMPPVLAPEILSYPLWFVEGMAEYLSLGPVDGQTAMWLRDAALGERLPHLKDLDRAEYFPYRWGHAFWAYVGAKYGDRAVASLIRSAANPRYDLPGLTRQLGTEPDTFTEEWHAAIVASTHAALGERPSLVSDARRLVDREAGGGRFNVGPSISPDGRYVVFFSERGRFSIDLYVADTESGQIVRRLSRSASDPHFDSLQFLNSTGGWRADGNTFVVAADRGGGPVLAFLEPLSGAITRELKLAGLDDALNPIFTPDGRAVVFSGNKGGLIDLYRIELETGDLVQLTSDPFADLEPAVTPDGHAIVFVTERFSMNLDTLEPGPLRLARLDLETREVVPIAGFLQGKHLSPQVSADGRTLVFIAAPDGISNLFRMPIEGGPIEQISWFPTGVAGITAGSPALGFAAAAGRMAFSVFEGDGHAIYVLDEPDVVAYVAPEATSAAALLPGRTIAEGDVLGLLRDLERGLPTVAAAAAAPPAQPYKRKLSLDFFSQPTITAGVNEFGAFIGGGVSAYFSDMLGDRLLALSVQAAGSFADIGGQMAYLNRIHRWNWGAVVEQLPYRVGYLEFGELPGSGNPTVTEVIIRQTSRGGSLVTAYPFSQSTRLEFSGGGRALSFTRENRIRVFSAETGDFIERRDTRDDLYEPLYLAEASAAIVRDTSFYGATGPIYGERYRLELLQSLGTLTYNTVLADWRKYVMPVRPVTVAVRGVHIGRYGRDAEHERLLGFELGIRSLCTATASDRSPRTSAPAWPEPSAWPSTASSAAACWWPTSRCARRSSACSGVTFPTVRYPSRSRRSSMPASRGRVPPGRHLPAARATGCAASARQHGSTRSACSSSKSPARSRSTGSIGPGAGRWESGRDSEKGRGQRGGPVVGVSPLRNRTSASSPMSSASRRTRCFLGFLGRDHACAAGRRPAA